MALSTVVKHFTDGSLAVKDGTGTPLSLTVDFTNADLAISGWSPQTGNRTVVHYQSKGVIKSSRLGERTLPQVSFSVMLTEFSDDGSNATLDSALRHLGAWSAAVSTLGANAEVKAFDLVWTIEGVDHGDAADYTVTMEDFVPTSISVSDGSPITYSVTGEVRGDITAS